MAETKRKQPPAQEDEILSMLELIERIEKLEKELLQSNDTFPLKTAKRPKPERWHDNGIQHKQP